MKNTLLTASVLALLSTASVSATNIVHTGLDWNRAQSIEIRADGSVRTIGAGVGVLLVDGIDYVDVLCVNLFQGITMNVAYAAQSIAAGLYDADGPAAAYLAKTHLPTVSTKAAGAALQLAVWDLIHDSGDGFATGRVRSTSNTNSTVLTLANAFRTEALGKSADASVFTSAPGARAFQQQMYLTGGSIDTQATPEPGSLALTAAGLLAIALGLRKR